MKTVIDLVNLIKDKFSMRKDIAPVETSSTASRAYKAGEEFYYGNLLQRATQDITQGSGLAGGVNFENADPVAVQVVSVKETLTNNVNVNGSKNVCPLKVVNQEIRGITITDSADGTYKVFNGTSTGNPIIISLLDTSTVYPVDYNNILSDISAVPPESLGIDVTKTYVWSRQSYDGVRLNLWLYKNGVATGDIELGTNANVNSVEVDFSQYDFNAIAIVAKIGNNKTLSNYALKPMLCLKSDWDFDNTWVPWGKTNSALTGDVVGLLENVNKRGSKNIFDFKTRVITSTPVTINSDGSSIRVYYNSASSWRNAQFLVDVEPNTEYRVVTEAIYTSGYGSVEIATEDDTVTIASISGTVITANRVVNGTFNSGDRSRIRLKLVASGGVAVVPDITFKNTMICLASNTDLTWEPYAMSNKELTEYIANMYEPHILCNGLKNTTVDLSSVPDYADIGILLNYSSSRIIGHYRKGTDLTGNGNYTFSMPSYYEGASINVGAVLRINNWQLSLDRYIWGGTDHKEDAEIFVWWSYV